MKLGSKINVATERLQASEAQAQLLRLQEEQAQLADMLVAELCKVLDQATANMRTAAELEVALRKEILEAHHCLAELEPAWDMFIPKHNAQARTASQSSGGCAIFGASQWTARRRFSSI